MNIFFLTFRIGLLELNVPDNSLEKTKRQRNAFEFAVRFSRNFLYPLKGMVSSNRIKIYMYVQSLMPLYLS